MLKKLLNRPIAVSMVVLIIIILGIVSIIKLPVSLIPDVDIPYVTVQVSAPAMSASEIEDAAVKPLRQRLIQLDQLDKISSESRDGAAVIKLQFSADADINYQFIEVNERIDRAMPLLYQVQRPRVIKSSATDLPAFYIDVTSEDNSDFLELSTFVRDVIVRRFEQLDEVAMVDFSGYVEPQILVTPDMEKLALAGISITEFESILRDSDIRLGNLSIRDGEYHFNVRFKSSATSERDISELYFKSADRVFQIKDVATVSVQPTKRIGKVISDGKDAIIMAVIKQNDSKMSSLKKATDKLISELEFDYPSVHFTVTRDQTRLLEYSINNLLMNIILGFLLTCLVLFVFMRDFKTTLLVVVTIPVSLSLSMIILWAVGISINIISLSGLLLGVGMMVDNTIILVDNITELWKRGKILGVAVIQGTKEVLSPMLSSVLTTCVVFIPLIFINGIAGKLFFDQAITITIVLLCSYLVTIIAIPVYYYFLYRNADSFHERTPQYLIREGQIINCYESIISFFLSKRWLSKLIFPICLTACILGFVFIHKSRLPEISYNDSIVRLEWNEDISLEENTRRTKELLNVLSNFCEQYTSMIGVQQFILRHIDDLSLSESMIYVNCASIAILNELKKSAEKYISEHFPLSEITFNEPSNLFDLVFSRDEPYILGCLRSEKNDVDDICNLLSELKQKFPGCISETIKLRSEIIFVANPEIMALYDVGFPELDMALRRSLNGNVVFSLVKGNRTIPVVISAETSSINKALSTGFISANGNVLPLNMFLTQCKELSFGTIISDQSGVYYPLELHPSSGSELELMREVQNMVRGSDGFDIDYSGEWFSNNAMLLDMLFVLIVALSLLFLILSAQFESLIQPFILLSEVVVDIAFCLMGLWAFGESLNLMSLIGLIVVCGIVINDSILKIDTVNKLRKSGYDVGPAIYEAGRRRLKAIVMTSLTTILAVCPFLFRGSIGNDLQYPMSLVIIIGMVVGTFVSLFYVPALYSFIYDKNGRSGQKE